MQRLLTSATLVALLVATAAAFAVTERLKLTKSALTNGTRISRAFSPVCGCHRSVARIRVVLWRADTVDVSIVDAHRREVATLVTGEARRRGPAEFRWTGRLDDGKIAPDGLYQVKIHFERQHQTIVVPNQIRLDTVAPQIEDAAAQPPVFSPDGDGQFDQTHLRWTFSKPAHAAFYLGGRRILYTREHRARGEAAWGGKAHGRLLGPGTYTLAVGAVDLAGNTTPVDRRVRIRVTIRYIVLASRRLAAHAGRPFEIGVSTDAKRYDWRLGTRRGTASGAVLTVRAPSKRGTYVLTVSEHGHLDRARVVVRR